MEKCLRGVLGKLPTKTGYVSVTVEGNWWGSIKCGMGCYDGVWDEVEDVG